LQACIRQGRETEGSHQEDDLGPLVAKPNRGCQSSGWAHPLKSRSCLCLSRTLRADGKAKSTSARARNAERPETTIARSHGSNDYLENWFREAVCQARAAGDGILQWRAKLPVCQPGGPPCPGWELTLLWAESQRRLFSPAPLRTLESAREPPRTLDSEGSFRWVSAPHQTLVFHSQAPIHHHQEPGPFRNVLRLCAHNTFLHP